jgi:hypothetical protein
MSEISLELVVGRKVVSRGAGLLGRIEEIEANDRAEVTHFLVGRRGLVERLSSLGLFPHQRSGYRIRWDQIDRLDAPTLTIACDLSEIERF